MRESAAHPIFTKVNFKFTEEINRARGTDIYVNSRERDLCPPRVRDALAESPRAFVRLTFEGKVTGGIITMYDNAAAVDVAWRTMSRA